MTELLLPLLEKAAPDARVITVSSGGMYSVPLITDLQVPVCVNWQLLQFSRGFLLNSQITVSMQFNNGKFNGVEQYARNKRVQVCEFVHYMTL